MPATRRKFQSSNVKSEDSDDDLPDLKKQSYDGFWDLSESDLENFVATCNLYKTVRLLLPNDFTDKVEDRILQLQDDDFCTIYMPKSDTEERNCYIICNKDDQTVTKFSGEEHDSQLPMKREEIGYVENLANVTARIATIISKGVRLKYNKVMQPGSCEIRILLNNKTAGRVIGNNGSHIREMKNQYKCNINVYREHPPQSADRLCQIYGNPQPVYEAVKKIISLQRTTNIDQHNNIEDNRKFYNAKNHIAHREDYGGFKTSQSMRASKELYKNSLPGNAKSEYATFEGCRLRFLFPSKIAGSVIGKGGEIINHLKEKYNLYVNAKSEDTADRVLTIHANQKLDDNKARAFTCFEEILTKIQKDLADEARNNEFKLKDPDASLGETLEDITEIRYLVNNSFMGMIVGSKGKTINKIREENNCYVHIFDDCCPNRSTDKVIKISGTVENIVSTVKEIYALTFTEGKVKETLYTGKIDSEFYRKRENYGGYIKSYDTRAMQMHNRSSYGPGGFTPNGFAQGGYRNPNAPTAYINSHNPNFMRQPNGPPSGPMGSGFQPRIKREGPYHHFGPMQSSRVPGVDQSTYNAIKEQVMDEIFQEYMTKKKNSSSDSSSWRKNKSGDSGVRNLY